MCQKGLHAIFNRVNEGANALYANANGIGSQSTRRYKILPSNDFSRENIAVHFFEQLESI